MSGGTDLGSDDGAVPGGDASSGGDTGADGAGVPGDDGTGQTPAPGATLPDTGPAGDAMSVAVAACLLLLGCGVAAVATGRRPTRRTG